MEHRIICSQKLAKSITNCYPFTRYTMRKEVILAVIIGVLLGGVILYGINLANNSSRTNGDDSELNGNSLILPSPTPNPENQISFISPLKNSVVTDAQVTLKGTAKPNSNVAIITESDDILTTVNATGNFSSIINLITGENIITVTTVDGNQATASASITIIRTLTLPE